MQAARAIVAASRANPEVFALGAKVGANAEFVAERIYHYYRDKRRRLTEDPSPAIITQSQSSVPSSPRMNKRKSIYSYSARKRAKYASPPVVRYRPNIEVKTEIFGVPTGVGSTANTLYFRDLSAITDGYSKNERIGSKISIIGVDINLHLGSDPSQTQLCLCSTYAGGDPVATDFYSNWAAPIDTDIGVSFWRHIGGSGTSLQTVNKKYRFRYPLTVSFKGSASDAYRNRLFMVFYCGAATSPVGGTMTIYYTDD